MIVEKLTCAVQCYDWGCPGIKSLVARFRSLADTTFVIEDSKPYAEVCEGYFQGFSLVLNEFYFYQLISKVN